MKKLLYIGIILILGSCGPNEPTSADLLRPRREVIKEEERIRMEVIEELEEEELEKEKRLEEEKRISSGYSIKIGNLEVMTKDLEEMEWEDAKKACADLGDGWRLPTKDELNVLYENKDNIGGFADVIYWSSTEDDDYSAWRRDFNVGNQKVSNKYYSNAVRAVRAF